MRLFTTIAGLRAHLEQHRRATILTGSNTSPCSIGLVPTMGALHAGHLSLVQRARQENGLVVVSIFINPLQFGPQEDFQHYPRTLEADQRLCEQAGVDIIFAPEVAELYGKAAGQGTTSLTQVVPPKTMTAVLCSPYRPGHFEGVATVVVKLLNIVHPDRAYFGQKDAQQLTILRRVVKDLNLPIEVIPCPTVREADGLAMSSRNRYLNSQERSHATVIFRALQAAKQHFHRGVRSGEELIAAAHAVLATVPTLHPQYVELVDPLTMTPLEQIEDTGLLAIAAHLGTTRLIDNVLLRDRQPIVAIDGPAGAGKSTVARRVAQQLGLLYLDTGAMYRAVTWLVLERGIPLEDEGAIAELVVRSEIRLEAEQPVSMQGENRAWETPTIAQQIWINGQEVTEAIRTQTVTQQVSAIAAQRAVRAALVRQQQEYGRRGGVVMDGRDIGTNVFPDAELKIFLTASVQERARRRQLDLKHRGLPAATLEELEQAIFERDRKDSTRAIAPLRKATDAVEIETDNLTIEAVTEKIVSLYRTRI